MATDDHRASGVSGAGSWAAGSAGPFVGDPGPAFNPEQAGEPPPSLGLHEVEAVWDHSRLRTILRAQGLLTHEAIGVGDDDWTWRENELAAIAEPLANSLNRHPVSRAAAAVSDELTVGAVFFEYAARSIRVRANYTRARRRAAAERVPVTGYDGAGQRVEPETWEHEPEPDERPLAGEVDWRMPE